MVNRLARAAQTRGADAVIFAAEMWLADEVTEADQERNFTLRNGPIAPRPS